MNYWQKRQQQLNSQLEKDEVRLKERLSSFYDSEYRKIENSIAAYYQNYGEENVILYRNLMEVLPVNDKQLLIEQMDQFAAKYPEYAHLLPVRESIYKLNRLEGLQTSIRMQQLEIGAVNNQELQKHLEKQAVRGVNAAAETMGFGRNFYSVNSDIVKTVVNTPWVNGEHFSKRIWQNTEKLSNYLCTDVAQAIARGDSYDRIVRNMKRRFEDVNRNDMYRLIYTEGTYVMSESTIQPFKEDFEKYRVSTAHDQKVCSVCRGVATQVYSIKDRSPGINFPPLHAWCRCTFEIVVEDWEKWMDDYENRHGNNMAKQTANRLNNTENSDTIQVKDPAKYFPRKTRKYTSEEDILYTNPNYKSGQPEWTRNCQRCVSAYEARRRGYDVTAKRRILDGTDTLPIMNHPKGWPSVYEGSELINCSSNTRRSVEKKIRENMKAWGDGARAIVRVRWKGGGGHVFIAEQRKGKTLFMDPQNGNNDVREYFKYAKKDGTHIMRVDNLEFTDRIKDCCEVKDDVNN